MKMHNASVLLIAAMFGICGEISLGAENAASNVEAARNIKIVLAVFSTVVDDSPNASAKIVFVSSDGADPEKVISALGSTRHIKLLSGKGEGAEMVDGRFIDSKTGLPCAIMRLDIVSVQEKSASVRYRWEGPKGGITIMTYSIIEHNGRWIVVSRKINLAS